MVYQHGRHAAHPVLTQGFTRLRHTLLHFPGIPGFYKGVAGDFKLLLGKVNDLSFFAERLALLVNILKDGWRMLFRNSKVLQSKVKLSQDFKIGTPLRRHSLEFNRALLALVPGFQQGLQMLTVGTTV